MPNEHQLLEVVSIMRAVAHIRALKQLWYGIQEYILFFLRKIEIKTNAKTSYIHGRYETENPSPKWSNAIE